MTLSDPIWRERADHLRSQLQVVLGAASGPHAQPSPTEIYSAATLENLVTISTAGALSGQDVSSTQADALQALHDYLAALPGFAPGLSPDSPSWALAQQQHACTRLALRPSALEMER